jgi:hypothetical protein
MALVLCVPVSAAFASDAFRPELVDSWHHPDSGVRLNIAANGTYEVVRADTVSMKGEIEVAFWGHTNRPPAYLVDVFVLHIKVDGDWWFVSGSFISGEGDPCGLWLNSDLISPATFFGQFDPFDTQARLRLRGTGP